MAAESLLNIPNDIKNQLLPFNIKGKGAVQKFTFRDGADKSVGNGALHIAPNSLYQNEYNAHDNDIANKSTFYNNYSDVTAKSILNSLPFITVREYMQEARLNQIFSIAQAIGNQINNFTNQTTQGEKTTFNANESQIKLQKFLKCFCSASAITSLANDIFGDLLNDIKTIGDGSKYEDYVIKIPYLLYYRLITTQTTNLYELPYNGQIMYESTGAGFKPTYDVTDLWNSTGGFINGVIGYFAKSIRVNVTPTWEGPVDKPITVKIDFSLYNDTDIAAVVNFIFVNTLIPNNMWVQYHLFQHSPSLYDIQIDGVNRLFMCQGDFSINQKGVLRSLSNNVLSLLKKYTNLNQSGENKMNASSEEEANAIEQQNINGTNIINRIRIPDVYEVSMTFTSLLPNNFNNFMYKYYINNNIDTITTEQGKIEDVVKNVKSAISKRWSAASDIAKNTQIIEEANKEKDALFDQIMSSTQGQLANNDSELQRKYSELLNKVKDAEDANAELEKQIY